MAQRYGDPGNRILRPRRRKSTNGRTPKTHPEQNNFRKAQREGRDLKAEAEAAWDPDNLDPNEYHLTPEGQLDPDYYVLGLGGVPVFTKAGKLMRLKGPSQAKHAAGGKKPGAKQRFTPEQVVEALDRGNGWVGTAADFLGCSPNTLYAYRDRYPEVKEAWDKFKERRLDTAEKKLDQMIRAGDGPSVRFLLNSLGKHRGYGTDTKQLVGPDGGPLWMVGETNSNVSIDIGSEQAENILAVLAETGALEAVLSDPEMDQIHTEEADGEAGSLPAS